MNKTNADDVNGGYLVPDVFVRGGMIDVAVPKPGLYYAILRKLGNFLANTGYEISNLGNRLRFKATTTKPEYIKGLLALLREEDQSIADAAGENNIKS